MVLVPDSAVSRSDKIDSIIAHRFGSLYNTYKSVRRYGGALDVRSSGQLPDTRPVSEALDALAVLSNEQLV